MPRIAPPLTLRARLPSRTAPATIDELRLRSLAPLALRAARACATPGPELRRARRVAVVAGRRRPRLRSRRVSPVARLRGVVPDPSRPSAPTSNRCRRRRTICGIASARATRCPTSTIRTRRQMGAVVFVAPGLRRAHDRPQPPLPVLHRGRGRAARDAARDRAAADGRERVQPGRAVDQPRVGHLAVHAVDRASTTGSSRTSGSTRGATSSPRPTARSPTCRSSTRISTTGSWRLPPTTGARATWRARSSATRRRASRPTTRASRCRTRRATTCRSCRRSRTSSATRTSTDLDLADIPDAPYFAVVKTTRKMDVQARRRARRDVGRGVPVPQSAAQPAGDRRRRRVRDPAADRQGRALCRQARAGRPAAGVVAGLSAAHRRDAAASRGASSGCRWKRCARSTASARRRRFRSGTRCWCRRRRPTPEDAAAKR